MPVESHGSARVGDPPKAGFEPLRRASRGRRTAVFLVGPLLWVVALVVLGAVVKGSAAVEIGLAVAGGSLIAGLAYLALQRRARIRAGGER